MSGGKTLFIGCVSALLILAVAFSIAPNPPSVVGYTGFTIGIGADGSYGPPGVPIVRSGYNYILTDDIIIGGTHYTNGIEVHRENSTIDGNGHVIQSTDGMGMGVYIHPVDVKNVTIKNLVIIGCGWGIYYNSTSLTITQNTFKDNEIGVALGTNNSVYQNNFIDSKYRQVTCGWTNGHNFLNSSYPLGGNYWSNYTGTDYNSGPEQDVPGSDGIGDTPHIAIDEYNIDGYPLMSPVDKTPPGIGAISFTPNAAIRPDCSVKATVRVRDFTTGVKNVTLFYTMNDGLSFENLTMKYNSSIALYEANMPKLQAPAVPRFKVVAYDNAGNEGIRDMGEQYSVIMPTCLSISTQSASAYAGYSVHINGTLCDFYGNYMKDEMIVLSYTFPGAAGWNQITSANTGALGNYYVEWISPATGSFTIKAEWTGNATYFGAVKNVSLSSTPYQNAYVFSVESNSTITALAFDTANWELSFTATGPSGTSG
nr:hypothetical protein [Candidatus Njordarchaeum guaymaensis]